MQSLEWFKSMVGKRVFREPDSCRCHHCANVCKKGIIVYNEDHAEYLYAIQNDFGAEGIQLNYGDEK